MNSPPVFSTINRCPAITNFEFDPQVPLFTHPFLYLLFKPHHNLVKGPCTNSLTIIIFFCPLIVTTPTNLSFPDSSLRIRFPLGALIVIFG